MTARFSSASFITPHAALEAFSLNDDDDDLGSPMRAQHAPGMATTANGFSSASPSAGASSSASQTPSRHGAGSRRSPHARGGELAPHDGDGDGDDGAAAEPEPEPEHVLVRARFDFEATDASALSFRAGDVIEVLTTLESGWWDGMLGNARGWFPSNYVEDLDEVFADEYVVQAARRDGTGSAGNSNGVTAKERARTDTDDDVFGTGGAGLMQGIWDEWGGGDALADLARGMMSGDDAYGFEEAARRRREAAARGADPDGVDDNTFRAPAGAAQRALALGADTGLDEFGVAARTREETERTVRPTHKQTPSVPPAGDADAWVPSLTSDGRVFYHNTQTGEDSWEMPLGAIDEDLYAPNDEDFYGAFARPASGLADSLSRRSQTPEETFLPPPKTQVDIPFPWVARMSDDGRGWVYVNRQTGETQRDLPTAPATMPTVPLKAGRLSADLRQRAAQDCEARLAAALRPVFSHSTPPPTMGALVDAVADAIREVFEAAVTGSAAEEEMSRARDLHSEPGMHAAIARDEAAREQLLAAHGAVVAAVRTLLRAFGYAGPALGRASWPGGAEDMARPAWASDMTLVGSLGLLAFTTHAAATSRRPPESGLTVWAEVMRAATKVKDVVVALPEVVLADTAAEQRDGTRGRATDAWFGLDTLGELMAGRYGYGNGTGGRTRPLDQPFVVDCQRLKAEVDALVRTAAADADPLPLLRAAGHLRDAVVGLDIASAIDVDGYEATADAAGRDDARVYAELVMQARRQLHDVDAGVTEIDAAAADMLLAMSTRAEQSRAARDSLAVAVAALCRALAALLTISQEQTAAVEQGVVRGQLGVRAVARARSAAAVDAAARPVSVVSASSRVSRGSRRYRPGLARGLEEEFLGSDGWDDVGPDESRDSLPEHNAALSPSQSSLVHHSSLHRKRTGTGTLTTSSSSTSLARNESDAGSVKGSSNRGSILKMPGFLRNRSASDLDDGRGTKSKAGSKKLAKLLGEDAFAAGLPATVPPPGPFSAPLPPAPPPEVPFYLASDYGPGEIIFDDKGKVKAGTIEALIERLTPHTTTEQAFFSAFLLTYRGFTTTEEMVNLLIQRYHIQPPPGLSPEQLQEWQMRKQTPIRLRVANTLKAWLDNYYIEAEDRPVLDRVDEFVRTTMVANGSELLSKQLLQLIERRRRGEGDTNDRRIVSGGMLSPPAPLLPRTTGRPMQLLDIAPLELARQLTIVESANFQRIKPRETLKKLWQSEDKEGELKAPNVRRAISFSNRMAGWLASEVLKCRDVKQRAIVLRFVIRVAMESRWLNNFATMAAIVAAINASPLSRLKRTWPLLPEKTQREHAELNHLMDSSRNFANYRETLKTVNPPCVPFLGFYLSAMIFIEEGNRDFYVPPSARGLPGSASTGSLSRSTGTSLAASTSSAPAPGSAPVPLTDKPLINFYKHALAAETLRDIIQYQSQPYNLAVSRPIARFVELGVEAVSAGQDLYELSLEVEPKEREDERITRMLHDSGFI
ncbi:cell division cycle-related protein [Cryptotrichosporon argae]